MLRRLRTPLAAALALAALAGCSDATGPDDERGRFELARLRWAASGVTDYRMTLTRSCECLPPSAVIVVVEGGVVVGVSDAATAEPLPPEAAALFPSIDGLFAQLGAALDGGLAVEATYHPQLGHPITVRIDPVPEAIDDEIDWTVSGLEPGAGAEVRAALSAARARWERDGFPHYDLDLRRVCDCAPARSGTVKVQVRGGAPVSRTYAPKGEPVDPLDAEAFPTLAGLFEAIADALDRGAVLVEVEFEPELGFPTRAAIVYREGGTPADVQFTVVKVVQTGLVDL